MDLESQLTRRERQIMGIVFSRGEASGTEILKSLPEPSSRGALRIMLRTLEDKGHLTHYQRGQDYVYRPTVSPQQVAPSALQRVLSTFFGGSLNKAVAVHLAQRDTQLSDEDLRNLEKLIHDARTRNKGKKK